MSSDSYSSFFVDKTDSPLDQAITKFLHKSGGYYSTVDPNNPPSETVFYKTYFLPFYNSIKGTDLYNEINLENDEKKRAFILMKMEQQAYITNTTEDENLIERINEFAGEYGVSQNIPNYEVLRSDPNKEPAWLSKYNDETNEENVEGDENEANIDDSSETDATDSYTRMAKKYKDDTRTRNLKQTNNKMSVQPRPTRRVNLVQTPITTPAQSNQQSEEQPPATPQPQQAQPQQIQLSRGNRRPPVNVTTTANDYLPSNEQSIESFSGEEALGRGPRNAKGEMLEGSYGNDQARAFINNGFNIESLKEIFTDMYFKGTSFLPIVDISDVKYNYEFGIPSKKKMNGDKILSDSMASYYTWIKASINELNEPRHFIFNGNTGKYTTIQGAYAKLLELVKAALTNIVNTLEVLCWNGENIGSDQNSEMMNEFLEITNLDTKETILARAFLFPFVRAVSHFHNCLGAALEEHYGPDIRRAVGSNIKLKARTIEIKSVETYIMSEQDDQDAQSKVNKRKRQTDINSLSIVGIMFSENVIRKLLKQKLYKKDNSYVTLRGCIGILHSCKNSLSGLFDSIKVFKEDIATTQTITSSLQALWVANIPKSQKIKQNFEFKFKQEKNFYDSACVLGRHILCGVNYIIKPSQALKTAVKQLILIKRDKRATVTVNGQAYTVSGDNKVSLFTNEAILVLPAIVKTVANAPAAGGDAAGGDAAGGQSQ